MHPDRNQAIHNFFNPEPMAQAQLYYVTNRARSAKIASAQAHPDKLTADLDQWQRELTANGEPDLTTVVVVLSGQYVAHVGPLDFYRVSNLRRAGVNFPGKPSTEAMRAK